MARHPQSATTDATAVVNMDSELSPNKEKPQRRRRGRRNALIALLVVALLAGIGFIGSGLYLRSVESGIQRFDVFEGVPEEVRPERVEEAKDALNILMLGSDSRDPDSSSGSRTDTIILAHLTKDRSSAQLISIPRDTWVSVPKSKDGRHGGVESKINSAFAWGGVPFMVQTIEEYTKVRIDHVAIVDFAGFKEIVDALGGITVDVDVAFTSTHSLDKARTYTKGPMKMDGATALDYARERYAFSDGDFARIRHQQQVIKAILDKAATGGTLSNPGKLNSFVRATTSTVSVDKTLNVLDMAMELRHLRSDKLGFYTSPTKGTGMIGDQSVVLPDPARASTLYDAIRRDSVDEILAAADKK
ncbi:LCP family protein [Micromonospora sp. NPDC050417]|uniref:LCP family protein n=1 Tax=Micromonospora sp. NPDC050417 TaxID=3364280 RepID=UPI0037879F5C